MSKITFVIILLFAFLFLPGIVLGEVSDLNNTSITLERGMCYGYCPVYSLTLFGNGSVIYDGQKYVKDIGIRSGSVNTTSFNRLIDRFMKDGFFLMKDEYISFNITDMPSATLTFINGTGTWKIKHYYGDTSAPKNLTLLENAVDQAGNVIQWTEPYDMQVRGRD